MHSGNCDHSQVSALVPAHGILSAPHGAEDTDEPAYSQFSTRRDARLAAKLVAAKVAAERERCAGVAEANLECPYCDVEIGDHISAAIRASK